MQFFFLKQLIGNQKKKIYLNNEISWQNSIKTKFDIYPSDKIQTFKTKI